MSTSKVKLCRDCRHAMPEPGSAWNLRCMHPSVNARDPYALSGAKPHGSDTISERSQNWTIRGRSPCGMRGALFEETTHSLPDDVSDCGLGS